MLIRSDVIQGALDLFESPTYVEVGVKDGTTFKNIRAAKKIAVDPRFVFDYKQYGEENSNSIFHETISDDFFGSEEHEPSGYDVVYLDGLHTFDQTLRDLLNTIPLVKPNGVIIIDDVVPTSYEASLPSQQECRRLRRLSGDKDRRWMGDVYRLVFFVHSYLQQFQYATVAENHGQLVMWRDKRPTGSFKELSVQEISALPYESTKLSRDLFKVTKYDDIIAQIKESQRK